MTATAVFRTCMNVKGKLFTGHTLRLLQSVDAAPVVQPLNLMLLQHRSRSTATEVDLEIKKFIKGDYGRLPDPDKLVHFRQESLMEEQPTGSYTMPHRIWTDEELHDVAITHKPPVGFVDKAAFYSVQTVRKAFDVISGFSVGDRNEYKWLKRIIFLETVAGVPGMLAAMTRHLHSLRRMQRDYGWIHTLLGEAENERMHLLTALQLKRPSRLFKWCVIGAQGSFVGMFSIAYLISPRFCHRFVGYLEEEAVKTYTKCLEDIDSGCMQHWQTQPSPLVATNYWQLPEDATMRDVILCIRADEANHRLVNHTLASMKPTEANPYIHIA